MAGIIYLAGRIFTVSQEAPGFPVSWFLRMSGIKLLAQGDSFLHGE